MELEEKVAQHGLSAVHFKGLLPRDQTIRAIKSARLLVVPSECYENFPMTIAEAFACGVPVICSRLGAMEEIVEDGRTGLHFAAGNAEDLAEKVGWAWNNPARVSAMSKDAREEYEHKYTAEKNYPILMDIYRRAIAENA
jgi:glycosyltransferase involved in cell wall biosynthesis